MTATSSDPVAPCAFCGVAGVEMVLQEMLTGEPPTKRVVWVCADSVPCLDRWWQAGKPGPLRG